VWDIIEEASWSITTQVKQEGTFLNVGESETAMLYEIREEGGKLKLFFQKKNGLKFRKSFVSHKREWVESFAERYLGLCCLRCKERGWVYKTRRSGGVYGGGARHGKGEARRTGATRLQEAKSFVPSVEQNIW